MGYVVIIPDQHSLVITKQWKVDRPDMWWWKCRDCFESSGVMSTKQLEKLEKKGMIVAPEPDDKLPPEYSRHPSESVVMDEEEYYSRMYGYGD